MKKFLTLALLVLPMILIAQRRPKIKGNRSVTEVSGQLPPFTAIELVDDLEIELKKTYGKEGYGIIADDNLVEVLKFDVQDSTLVISSFYDITTRKKLEIVVHINEVRRIAVKKGKVFAEDMIESDELYLNTFGNAKLDIDASGFRVMVNAEDNSSIQLNLDVDSLTVGMKHKTDGIIYAVSGAQKVDLADTASLTLEGTTEDLQVEMVANSKLKADKLEAATVGLSNTESGFARVNAQRTFSLRSAGNGKTHLYGNPKITIKEFIGASQLIKKGG